VSKFDWYVGRGVLVATIGVLMLLVGLDALTSIVDETDDMRDGYGFSDILIYVGYTLPRRFHEFVPFAALIGVLVGLGRLATTSELVVIRAAGVSMFRMAAMALKPALLVAAVGFGVGEFVAPHTEQLAMSYRALAQRSESSVAAVLGLGIVMEILLFMLMLCSEGAWRTASHCLPSTMNADSQRHWWQSGRPIQAITGFWSRFTLRVLRVTGPRRRALLCGVGKPRLHLNS